MLGFGPLHTRPLNSFEQNPRPSEWRLLLQRPVADLVVLVEVELYDTVGAGTVWRYFADAPYASAASDSPASTVYDPRVLSVQFRFAAGTGRRLGGRAAFDGGDVEIAAHDGGLDDVIAAMAVDGRAVRVLAGGRLASDGTAYRRADFRALFTGTAAGWSLAKGVLRLALRGIDWTLDKPVNPTRYAGSGGGEGGDDLKSKQKPRALGRLFNVALPRVSSAQDYHANDGQVQALNVARDTVALVLDANYDNRASAIGQPGGGEFSTSTAEGWVVTGSKPVYILTADIQGDAPGGAFVETQADIMRRLALAAGLTPGRLEPASFAALNTATPDPIGVWFGPDDDARVADAFDMIAGSGELVWGEREDGRLFVLRIAGPSATPAGRLTGAEIYDYDIDPLPAEVAPAVWRAQVGYQRAWHRQTEGLDANISEADRLAISTRYRFPAAAEDTAVQTRHALAQEIVVGDEEDGGNGSRSLWATAAGAAAHQAHLLATYAPGRRLFRVETAHMGWQYRLGDVVALTLPDEPDVAALPCVVLAKEVVVNPQRCGCELVLFG